MDEIASFKNSRQQHTKRDSVDTGICSDNSSACTSKDASDDAIRGFFSSFVPRMSNAYIGNNGCVTEESDDDDDPSIDLDNPHGLALKCPQSPIPHHRHQIQKRNEDLQVNDTFSISSTKEADSTLDELKMICTAFKANNNYAIKLKEIMLKGMKGTLGAETFNLFTRGRLPNNFVPIVMMNSSNTPYVEFLVKYHEADLPPQDQLRNYTNEHMIYNTMILDHLTAAAKQSITGSTTSKSRASAEMKQQIAYKSSPASSTPRRRSAPAIKRSLPPFKAAEIDLNNSKRILPPRACKLNTSSMK